MAHVQTVKIASSFGLVAAVALTALLAARSSNIGLTGRQSSHQKHDVAGERAAALAENARRAEEGGDFALADRLFSQVEALRPGLADYPIAKLHDKMGKYTEAISDYKRLFAKKGGYSDIALLLTRCADLDMLFGSKSDAREEYLSAASQPNAFGNGPFSPTGAGERITRDAPLEQLRACAYYNAGTILGGHGGRKYMELALTLEPKSPLMRLGFAWLGNPEDRAAGEWLAEQEATGKMRAAIHAHRVGPNRDDVYSRGTIMIRNGVATDVGGIPYKATGPVTAPHVPDPILKLRNPRWADEGAPVTSAP